MFLNSKTLQCDVSQMWTCDLCSEKPVFFNRKDLVGHCQRCHFGKTPAIPPSTFSKEGQSVQVGQRLRDLEEQRNKFLARFDNIRREYEKLVSNGLVTERTVQIVKKEIANIQTRITMNEQEIQMEKSCLASCLLDSLITTKPPRESGESESNSSRETGEEVLKEIIEQSGTGFSAAKLDRESVKIQAYKHMEKLKTTLHDKEIEIDMLRELSANYKQYGEMYLNKTTVLKQELASTDKAKEVLSIVNADLTQDLKFAITSLKRAQEAIDTECCRAAKRRKRTEAA